MSYLRIAGAQHELRANLLVELLRGQEAKRNGSFLESCALLVSLLGAFGNVCTARKRPCVGGGTVVRRTVIAEMAVENSSQHEGLMKESVNTLLVRDNTDNTVLREGPRA